MRNWPTGKIGPEIVVRVPESMRVQLDERADAERTTRSDVVRRMIEEGLKQPVQILVQS